MHHSPLFMVYIGLALFSFRNQALGRENNLITHSDSPTMSPVFARLPPVDHIDKSSARHFEVRTPFPEGAEAQTRRTPRERHQRRRPARVNQTRALLSKRNYVSPANTVAPTVSRAHHRRHQTRAPSQSRRSSPALAVTDRKWRPG